MKKPSVNIYYDKRGMKKGEFSVKWSVYFNGVQKLFASGTIVKEYEAIFLKKNKAELTGKVKDDNLRYLWETIYGSTYIDDLTGVRKDSIILTGKKTLAKIEDVFSFELFASVVSGNYTPENKTPYPTDLIVALTRRAAKLKVDEDLGNASLFESTAASFKRFAVYKKLTSLKNPQLPIKLVTSDFLKSYETWMLKYGKAPQKKGKKGANPTADTLGKESPASITTVGIYTRNVRTIFNEAIDAEVVNEKLYPFGAKGGFVIPASKNTKKAFDGDVIAMIFNYECKPGSVLKFRRDMWLFSYISNGINFSDICRIKRKNTDLKNAEIKFVRKKTKNTKRDDISEITIKLFPITLQVIEEWGNKNTGSDEYLFPFLDNSMDEERRQKVIEYAIKTNNKYMNKIAKDLGIDIKMNTYAARHSFATTLLRSEAPLAFISQQLGHGSIATTQKYLGSFEDDKTQQYLSALFPSSKEEEKKEETEKPENIFLRSLNKPLDLNQN